jgi:Fe-S-cluster containining protein
VAPVFALDIHAAYRCQRTGACCTSDWDIPVEAPLYRELDAAVSSGRLRRDAASEGVAPFIAGPDLPLGAAAIVARVPPGRCVFYDARGLCAVHRDLGETRLPESCRHFPRLALVDPRGTFITLTHYCPTAAATLFASGDSIEIVEGPAAFPPGDYGGLRVDAETWPPLLHPRMLMDFDGYAAWERHMVARCGDARLSPEQVIQTLARDARALRAFVPGQASLADAVARLPCEPLTDGDGGVRLVPSVALHAEVLAAVPSDIRPAPGYDGLEEVFARDVAPRWSGWQTPLRRYLAARAFGNWLAYQGKGIQTIVGSLESALAIVRVEAARECRAAARALDRDLLAQAIRSADLLLNHLAAAPALVKAWSRFEDGDHGSVIARPDVAKDLARDRPRGQ